MLTENNRQATHPTRALKSPNKTTYWSTVLQNMSIIVKKRKLYLLGGT